MNMKKYLSFILCICFVLAGCAVKMPQEPLSTTTPTVTAHDAIVPQQEAMYSVSVPVVAENTLAEDRTVIFSYTRPTMMLTIPEPDIANKVIIDFQSRIEKTSSTASAIRASAENRYNETENWTPHLYNITYNPTRIDPGVLSLIGTCVTYTGGSHPERLSVAANYDLVTGDVLTLGSIMSASATTTDFCNLAISALNALKDQKNLYDDFESYVYTRISRDESQNQDWYFSTTGLCFFFDPYEIAPYASGTIIAEIPYSDLAGLIYEGYFPAEQEITSGTISAQMLDAENVPFTQIAELVLDADGDMALLYTDGIVWNVTVEYGAWDTANESFAPVYTALFSSALSPGDGIMIQSNEFQALRITYQDGTEVVTQHFNRSADQIQLVN